MFTNYLITALRNMNKKLSSTLIQAVGLAVGIAVFILAQLIVSYEESFDTFFKKYDRIYSVYINVSPAAGLGVRSTDGVFTALQPILQVMRLSSRNPLD